MGLFSSSTKIYVASSALHLMEMTGNESHDTSRDAVISAILKSQVPYITRQDITAAAIKSKLNTSIGAFDKFYQYAQDSYKLGLPSGATLDSNPINPETIAPYIATDIGYPDEIMVVDYLYTEHTPELDLYDYLINTRGYDRETDTITIYPTGTTFTEYYNQSNDTLQKKVQLGEININSDNVSATIHYELFVYRPTTVYISAFNKRVEYQWVKDPNTYTENISIPGATSATIWGGDCLFAVYKKFDHSGTLLLPEYGWVYNLADGTYPELEKAQTTGSDTYLPVVPLRYNNQDLTNPATQNTPEDPTNLFSTSKKLLQYLNMDFQTLGNRLNENPDIADIDHAYVTWGADFQTDYAPTLYYLMEYFYNIYQSQTVGETSFLATLADPTKNTEPVSTSLFNSSAFSRVQESPDTAFKEYGLALSFIFDYITEDTAVDTIGTGKPGYAEKSIESYSVSISTTHTGREGDSYTSTRTETRYKYIIKAQITDNLVRTITVHNPKTSNWIYGNKRVITTLGDVASNPDEHNMILPLEYNLVRSMDWQLNYLVLYDCCLIVINSIEKVKVKWYQKGFFKMLVVVIGIVITVWSGGAAAWINKLTAAYAAYGIVGALVFIGATIGASMIISGVTHWIVKELGPNFALLAAVILVIVAAASTKYELLKDAFKSLMTNASEILQISQALVSSANEFLVKAGQGIVNEYEDFVDKLSGLWDELKELQDLTAMKANLDPLSFTSPARFRLIPNETPAMFFQRTLGLAHNSVFPIHDEIYNFYDIRFNLDTLNTYS